MNLYTPHLRCPQRRFPIAQGTAVAARRQWPAFSAISQVGLRLYANWSYTIAGARSGESVQGSLQAVARADSTEMPRPKSRSPVANSYFPLRCSRTLPLS